MESRSNCSGLCVAVVAALAAVTSISAAEPFPVVRPATRAQAAATLVGGAPLSIPCLSSVLQSRLESSAGIPPAARRALAFLQAPSFLPGERRFADTDGTVVRYSMHPASFDRINPTDDDRNGIPDRVEIALDGIAEARRVLVGDLGLAAPDPVEILLAKTGIGLDGYLVPTGGRDGRPLIVLDGGSGEIDRVRSAAIHQYAHAVALTAGTSVSAEWSEAFATWAVTLSNGGPDTVIASVLADRFRRLNEGMATDAPELAAGNSAWLAFLDEAYGRTTLRLALEELAEGSPAPQAFDRAVRRTGGAGIAEAFRDFQLWTVLTGERATGRQFSFADRLPSPQFATVSEGLPALAVQTDPAVAPMGAAAVLLRPEASKGGLAVRFEGETPGKWEADLILTREDGELQRVALPLTDGKGEVTIPVSGIREALVLMRNVETTEQGAKLHYSWSARAIAAYPFDATAVQALLLDSGKGVEVSWETRSEQGLLGFNIVRLEAGVPPVRVNPVWIPALGDTENPARYQFVDRSALSGRAYSYAIEGVTTSGLASATEPTPVMRTLLPR